jgi:enoyl-CoA hydratase/carnithine racemase
VKFSIPEAKFGVIPGDADILEKYVPPGIAREMLFFGDSITAQRAYEIGMVNKVVPPEQLMNEATAMAEKLRENSPLALQGIKEMLSRSKDMGYRKAVALYDGINDRIARSKDYEEGMKAMAEKRKPDWQGR